MRYLEVLGLNIQTTSTSSYHTKMRSFKILCKESACVTVPVYRNGSIDLARFLGSVAIVWFHLGLPGSSTALSALHLFILLQIYYGAGRSLVAQAKRLLVPWAFWSGVYAVAKIGQAALEARPLSEEFHWWMLFTGPSIHLWYLPFSFLALVVCNAVWQRLSPFVFWGGMIAAFLGAIYVSNIHALPTPLGQWTSVVPAVVVGLALRDRAPGWHNVILWGALAASIAVALGFTAAAWQTFVAVILVGAAIAFPFPSTSVSRRLSDLSFGIYLVHPAFVALCQWGTFLNVYLMFATVLSLSIGLTFLLRRFAPVTV